MAAKIIINGYLIIHFRSLNIQTWKVLSWYIITIKISNFYDYAIRFQSQYYKTLPPNFSRHCVKVYAQLVFTDSKLTTKTLEQGVKYVKS